MAGSDSSLVSTTWLNEQLKNPPGDLKVLDSSSTSLESGQDDYLSSHIPGAQFFDLLECMTPTPFIPRNLPDVVCLQEYVRSLGVNKGDYVVLYDRGDIYASCRAWWTLRALGHERVAVLDGGIQKWTAEGLATESGEAATPVEGNCELQRNSDIIKMYDDVVDMVTKEDSYQLVDARLRINFWGLEEEPSIYTKNAMEGVGLPDPTDMKRGHVKGAVQLDTDEMFDQELMSMYKVFLEKEKIQKVFQGIGVDLDKPLTTMCYVGNAASVMALSAYLCGKEDVASYYGSWTEFGQRAGDDVIEGPVEK